MARGLISERGYPWAVEPARLNGSIRHRKAAAGRASEAYIGVVKRSPRLIQADGGDSGDVKLWNDVKYFSFFSGVTRSREPADKSICPGMAEFVLVTLVNIGDRFVHSVIIQERSPKIINLYGLAAQTLHHFNFYR